MRNRIDVSDIRKRKSILAESSEMSKTITISNAYERAKKSNRIEDIRHFMQECGSSRYNATEYAKPCIEFIEETKSPELISIFKSNILPRINDFEIGYLMEAEIDKDVKELIHEQIVKNKIADRVIANHEKIDSTYNISSMYESFNSTTSKDNVIKLTCAAVNEFDLPLYAKVNISIEESAYSLQRSDIDYNDLELARSVIEFFSIHNTMSKEDIDLINKVIRENYMIEDVSIDNKFDSKIIKVVDQYIARDEHNNFELKIVDDKVFASDFTDWMRNIGVYFDLLTNIVLYGDEASKRTVIETIIAQFYNRFTEKFGGSIKLRELIKVINQSITEDIIVHKLDGVITLTRNTNNLAIDRDSIEEYRYRLIELVENLTDLLDMTYTKEDIEFMTEEPLYEAFNTVTLYEFKDHKYDPLISKMYKFDKFLQREIRGWAQRTGQKLANTIKGVTDKISQKMYEEISIFDMIVDNNIDYVVDSFYFDPENVNYESLHKEATALVKSFNESELYDSSIKVYYTLESDRINFHMKDNTSLLLSEDEKILVGNNLSESEMDRLIDCLYANRCINENFDFVNEAIKFFKKNPDSSIFSTFCEACSLAGVTKEVITEIYEAVVEAVGPSFVYGNNFKVSNYIEAEADTFFATQALLLAESLITEAKDEDEDEEDEDEDYDDEEDEEEDDEDDDEDKDKDKSSDKKPAENKDTTEKKEVSKPEPVPTKGINLNNIKLYIQGLKKNMKDLDSKTQTTVRNMDFMVEKLINDIKKAMVSDRRESIIKGSVIPSFHKCILIAVGLAGLAWFNAPLAIITAIGGFAVSKKLTEKERALLMDDIEIELELVEKEIQMADSRNQVKKLRQLMKMKKQLQREYQRIKYNIRLGKDIIPSSAYVPNSGNND